MAEAILRLASDKTNGKALEIVSKGPKQAQILLPVIEGDIELMDDTELRSIMSKKIVDNALLDEPIFKTPVDGTQDYNGDFILEPYNLNIPMNNPVVSTIYQISPTKNFSYFSFSKTKQSNQVEPLTVEDLINSNLEENTVYYIRARIYFNNYMTRFSSPLSFTIGLSSYKKPIIKNIEVETVNGNKTGNVIFNITPDQPEFGTPGEANVIEYHIANVKDNNFVKLEYEKSTFNTKLRLIPFVLYPDNTYKIKVRYYNSKKNLYSPFSDVETLTLDKTLLKSDGLHINQQSSVISTNPTIGVNGLLTDFNLLDNLNINWNNVILPTNEKDDLKAKFKDCYFRYVFTLKQNNLILHTTIIEKKYDEVVNNYYKGCLFSLSDYDLKLSTTYDLTFNFEWKSKTGQDIDLLIFNEESIRFSTGNFFNTVPKDNIETIFKSYNNFSYYGEVTVNTLLPEDITYRGKAVLNREYPKNSEVVINDELYITKTRTTLTSFTNLTDLEKITKQNMSTYYNSGLPSGKWLIRELGIPVDLDNISGVVNNKEGWIKVHNKANQILYIAKKPFITNIDYDYLKDKFLTGHGCRTLRIGLHLYNVRLLEYSPTSFNKEEYTDSTNSNRNVQDELNLFKTLFKELASYSPNDLGIIDNDNINYTNNGYFLVKDNNGQLSFKYGKLTEEITGSLKMYRPVLELIQEGYEPFRDHIFTYDKWSDTGYFGKVHHTELFNTKELTKLTGLLDLNILTPNPQYYKFYYHGLIVYIPTRPLGDGIDYERLEELNLVQPSTSKPINLNGKICRVLLPNLTNESRILQETMDDLDNYDMRTSIVHDLLGRVLTNLPSTFINRDTSWEYDQMDFLNNIILQDTVYDGVRRKRVSILNNKYVERDLSNSGLYLPVIVTEALNFYKDLTYPSASRKDPIITQVQITVTKYRIEEEQVERVREVEKSRIVTDYREVVIIDKIPTGKIIYKKVKKNENDKFGLLLFHSPKEETAYLEEDLYRRKQLNVILSNKQLKIGYSTKYPDINTFICKSVMITEKTKLTTEPLHVNTFFNTATEAKEFIQNAVVDTINICSLKNKAYNKVLINKDKTLPIGMVFGKISSEYSYYPVNRFYNLSSPNYDTTIDLNYSPTISENNGVYKNSWTKVMDNLGNDVVVPMLNSLINYEDYTNKGKRIIDKYINYLNSLTGININLYQSDYSFGIVAVDLETLCYLSGNGFLSGDKFNPSIINFPDTYTLPSYIGPNGYSNGEDFIDIINPVEEVIEKPRVEIVPFQRIEKYIELETYTETIYKQVPYQDTVTVDKVVYP